MCNKTGGSGTPIDTSCRPWRIDNCQWCTPWGKSPGISWRRPANESIWAWYCEGQLVSRHTQTWSCWAGTPNTLSSRTQGPALLCHHIASWRQSCSHPPCWVCCPSTFSPPFLSLVWRGSIACSFSGCFARCSFYFSSTCEYAFSPRPTTPCRFWFCEHPN